MAVALLVGALAPGLWWRSDHVPRAWTGELTVRPLAQERVRGDKGVTLAGAWQLSSGDARFGGYSALVARPGGRLRAYSDSGRWLEFIPPGALPAREAEFGDVRQRGGKFYNDVEAAAYDAETGTTWLALEFTNTIRRIGRDTVEVAPPAMAGFRDNDGAEAMARLPDGRFVVLEETADPLSPTRRTGLLFATDPVIDERATAFVFEPPLGYDPADAATLPDGRVLILLRALSLRGFPPFDAKLVVADPAGIEAGRPWPWREVAHLSAFAPRENYEGLAVLPGESGLELWLVSDSNHNVLLQRTLLLKLIWKDWREARQAPPARAVRRPSRLS